MKKFKFRSFIALIFGLAMILIAPTVSAKSEKVKTPQQSITATSIDMPGCTVASSYVFTAGDNESQVAKVAPAVSKKVDMVAANFFKKTDQTLTGEIMAYTGTIAAENVKGVSCDLQKMKQDAITSEMIMAINDTGQNLNEAQMLKTNTIGASTVGFDGKMRTGYQVLKHPTFVVSSNV